MVARFVFVLVCVAGSVAQAEPEVRKASRLGVMADVGLPDGAIASVVYRPIHVLRVHAGIGHNYVSNGVRAGMTLIPFRTWLTPTLSVDYGRYFKGDANPLARVLSGDASYSSSHLEHVGYDYANGHVGIQLGRARASFYIDGGVSRVTSEGSAFELNAMDGGTVNIGESRVTMWSVSGRMGLILYLL